MDQTKLLRTMDRQMSAAGLADQMAGHLAALEDALTFIVLPDARCPVPDARCPMRGARLLLLSRESVRAMPQHRRVVVAADHPPLARERSEQVLSAVPLGATWDRCGVVPGTVHALPRHGCADNLSPYAAC
ncbi:hypothetical protein [Streptomyces zagrosensis]|uniref:Uncharacterized protein n=1 Tax=Streptomyces zagrosensis TaxID=1042984 RepID=A0A7W9UX53_9ACTN|nr:hypothetical protein [Streptomyces zagrosensis]